MKTAKLHWKGRGENRCLHITCPHCKVTSPCGSYFAAHLWEHERTPFKYRHACKGGRIRTSVIGKVPK